MLSFLSLFIYFFFSWKLTEMAWIPQECGSLAFLSPCTVQYWWQIGVIKEQKQWPEQSRDCLGLAFHKQKLTTFQQWSKYVSYIYQKKKKIFFPAEIPCNVSEYENPHTKFQMLPTQNANNKNEVAGKNKQTNKCFLNSKLPKRLKDSGRNTSYAYPFWNREREE